VVAAGNQFSHVFQKSSVPPKDSVTSPNSVIALPEIDSLNLSHIPPHNNFSYALGKLGWAGHAEAFIQSGHFVVRSPASSERARWVGSGIEIERQRGTHHRCSRPGAA